MEFVKALVVAAALVTAGASAGLPDTGVRRPENKAASCRPSAGDSVAEARPARDTGQQAAEPHPKQGAALPPRVTTLLMFYGRAEEAMKLYTSVIKNSRIMSVRRYGKGEAGAEGSVMHATFTLDGREFTCIDSIAKHDFTFTPATSLFVTCQSEEEIDDLFVRLSRGGKVFMPLRAYPFAKKFAWFTDTFGVSWQLSWPQE